MPEDDHIQYYVIEITGASTADRETFVTTFCKDYDFPEYYDVTLPDGTKPTLEEFGRELKNHPDNQNLEPEQVELMWQLIFPRLPADINWGEIMIDANTRLVLRIPANNRRFDFLWGEEFEHATVIGHIVLFDSACPPEFREMRSIMETYRAYAPFPYLFAADFHNQPDAWPSDDLRLILDIPAQIPIVPYETTNYDSVKNVVLALLHELLHALEDA